MNIRNLATVGLTLGLMAVMSGCVVTPRGEGYREGYREGYYDREHHRWWAEHRWHECEEHDVHCQD